jgi:hypothetical protein
MKLTSLHSYGFGRIDLNRRPGLVSATIIVMVVTGAFGGGLVGLILRTMLGSELWLAIVAAFAAVIIAFVAQHIAFNSQEQFSFPGALSLSHLIISALIGGLAGHELAVDLREPPTSGLIGGISGLLAAALFSCFVITSLYRQSDHN